MSIPDQKFVKVKINPIEKDLKIILKEAFQDWREITEKKLLTLGRTRAVIIHDRALSKASKILPDKGIKIEDKYETAQFNIDDELLFRFKKGDGIGLSRNYATTRANAYHEHYKKTSLWPPIPRVEIVYTLNYLATEMNRIYVVARDRARIAWKYAIWGQIGATLYQVPLSFPQSSPSTLVKPLYERELDKEEGAGKE